MTPYFILSIETHDELLPFINLKSHGMSSVGYCITDEGNFCQIMASLRLLLAIISCSFFIKLYAFSFHFALRLSPLEKMK